eukprot:COSAG01_NODE_4324_length_5132_cov_4.443274_3_plen_120_part_01
MPRSVVLLAAAVGCALIVGADAQTKRGPPRPVQPPQKPCLGDTRGDRKCAHDSTHRVCARIRRPSDQLLALYRAALVVQHARELLWTVGQQHALPRKCTDVVHLQVGNGVVGQRSWLRTR